MGNKQEESEATVQLASYELVAITETQWNESCDWSTAIDAYKLFRRDWQGRRAEAAAFCVKKLNDCIELPVKNND